MATKNIEIQDSAGNIYYPHTDASIVKFGDSNVNATLSDMVYQTVGGSATTITLTIKGTLVNGYPITFIASTNNGGAATTINGKKLYKPGTTTSPNLIAGKAYTVWYNSISDCFFIKASAEGDADVSNVLATKKFSNDNDTGLVGTMPNITADQTAITIAQSGTNVSFLVQRGYWDGTKKLNAAATAIDSDCITGNIKAGANIMGVVGKSSVVDTADANASAGQILSGQTTYVNGIKVTGTMPSKAAATYTPTTSDQAIAAAQYLSGAQTIKGDANLVSGNIKAGTTIFGVAGNSNIVDTSAGTAIAGHIVAGDIAFVDGVKVTGTMPDRGNYQYTGGIGGSHDNATGKDYIALNNIPEGYYHKDGLNWAPEVRIPTPDLISFLGLTDAKLTRGSSVLGITGTGYAAGTSFYFTDIPRTPARDTSYGVNGSTGINSIDVDMWNCLYVGKDYHVYRYDYSGALLWTYTQPLYNNNSIATNSISYGRGSNFTVHGSEQGYVTVLEYTNGNVRWSSKIHGANMVQCVKYSKSLQYIYSVDSAFYLKKINASTGSVVWSVRLEYSDSDADVSDMDVDEWDNVIVACKGTSKIYFYNSSGGLLFYWYAAGLTTVQIDSGRNIYVGAGSGNITKLDKGGNVTWTINLNTTVSISSVRMDRNPRYIHVRFYDHGVYLGLIRDDGATIYLNNVISNKYSFYTAAQYFCINDFGDMYSVSDTGTNVHRYAARLLLP